MEQLSLSSNKLTGERSVPVLSGFSFADTWHCIPLILAGELPKGLGKLVNLAYFNVARNELEGGLSTRAELHERRASKSDSFAQALSLSSWGSW